MLILAMLLVLLMPAGRTLAEQEAVKVRREKPPEVLIRKEAPPAAQYFYEEVIGEILKFQFKKGRTDAQRQAAVWLSVRTKAGEPIADLQPGNFSIVEVANGTRRSIHLADVTLERRSLATVLLRDVSASMNGEDMAHSRRAIEVYVAQLRAGDLAEVIFFGSQIYVVKSFRESQALLRAALRLPFGGGGTALFGAILTGLNELEQLGDKHLKALVVFTDGDDTASSRSFEEILTITSASAVPIFAVGVGEANTEVLQRLANASRGRYFPADAAALASIYDLISRTLKASCLLSYPSSAQPGETVSLEVVIRRDRKTVGKFYGQQVAP